MPSARVRFAAAVLPVLTLVLSSCGGGDDEEGGPSGATCPESSALTYESFGRGFMAAYCTRCHSASLSSSDRNGAPSDHNFDTLEGILDTPAEHLDEQAASGPAHTNTSMPPDGPAPSLEQRSKLGEWLACGTP